MYGTEGSSAQPAARMVPFDVEQKGDVWPFTLFLSDSAAPLLQTPENEALLRKMVQTHRRVCQAGFFLATILFSVTITAHADLAFLPIYALIAASAKMLSLFAERRRSALLFLLHILTEGVLVIGGVGVIVVGCWMGIHELEECKKGRSDPALQKDICGRIWRYFFGTVFAFAQAAAAFGVRNTYV